MPSQKKGSKGRFPYLFDWHAKSRKKLFPSKSEPSGSNQGRENVHNLEIPQLCLREPRANGDASVFRGSGSCSSASSINGDDEFGTKAPGVVARLMGLDSLPITTTSEPISASLLENHTLGNSYYPRHAGDFQFERRIMDHSYAADKLEGIAWNSMNSRPSKVHGRPIDRFQTETLPPRSAKPISVTHHKLLSPIKSPGFIPSKDPAYIMEAAARIIDTAPASPATNRVSSFGSSTPMRMRDLKERMNAANRSSSFPDSSKKPKQVSSVNQARLNSRDRVDHLPLLKASLDTERSRSCHTPIKGKAVSSASLSKDKYHRKDGTTSSNNKILVKKEHKQEKMKQSSNNQLSTQKTGPIRTSVNKSANVLRQNGEKQNRVSNKDKSTSMSSAPNQQIQHSRKGPPVDVSPGPSKVVNKVFVNSESGSKKVFPENFSKKRHSLSKMKNISRNKELIPRDSQSNDTTADILSASKDGTAVRHDSSLGDDYRRDMDVISFTFTSPIKRFSEVKESNHFEPGYHDPNDVSDSIASSSSLLRLKLIGGDDLSLLLEQKLKELTDKVELSQSDSVRESTDGESIASLPDSVSRSNGISSTEKLDGMSDKFDPDLVCDDSGSSEANRKGKDFESTYGQGCSSTSKRVLRGEADFGCLDLLVPEYSLTNGSCVSSNDTIGYFNGRNQMLLPQSQEQASCTSKEFHAVEDERDFFDTASSMYNDDVVGKRKTLVGDSTNWDFEYVRHILHYSRLKEADLTENSIIIPFSIFDLLENLLVSSGRTWDDISKLWRKTLFDCVNECVSLRYCRAHNGSYNSWTKWFMLSLQHEDWLTEDLCREIICLEDMRQLMVDEVVYKDMGTQYGGWLDFEMEAIEEGIEIETDIVASLVDELVVDLCSSY